MRKVQAMAAVQKRGAEESLKVAGNSNSNGDAGKRGRRENRKAEEQSPARDVLGRRLGADEQEHIYEEEGDGEWSSNSNESDGASDNRGGVFLRLLHAIQPVSHVYWED